jgi:hypothetical protein
LSIIAASVVRLAGAGRAGDEHEAARLLGQLLHDRRQLQLLEAHDLERDLADRHGHAAALLEDVAAEAGQVRDAEREVEFVLRLEPLLLRLRQDRVCDVQRVLRREHVLRVRVHDVAVDAQLRSLARRDVQVAAPALDHLLQQRAKVDRLLLLHYAQRCCLGAHYAAVSLMTSSSVVTPRATFFMPSMRSVSMPSLQALVAQLVRAGAVHDQLAQLRWTWP